MKKLARIAGLGLLALALTGVLVAALLIKVVLAPAPSEWSTRVRLGPVGFELGVPTALRLATAPWFAPHLDGRTLRTAHGPVHLRWNAPARALELRCAPCRLDLPALGAQPLRLAQARLSVRRDFETLAGTLEATHGDAVLHGRWQGTLSQKALRLDLDLPDAPIADWYAVFAAGLPELARAEIGGRFGLQAQIALPEGRITMRPRVTGFTVAGLGTEALLGARSACGQPSRLTRRHWLARAVLAAEDQRFFEHPGYDLVELVSAFDANQRADARGRGASTLSQQLAKLLVTGDARTLERKLRELLYAVEMERTLGKTRMLQLYLDNVPWGPNGLCGAEAAARHYFGRGARALEPVQAVWLASMLNAPTSAAQRWAREGTLAGARVQWVAEGIRGVGRASRAALLRELPHAHFAPPH